MFGHFTTLSMKGLINSSLPERFFLFLQANVCGECIDSKFESENMKKNIFGMKSLSEKSCYKYIIPRFRLLQNIFFCFVILEKICI